MKSNMVVVEGGAAAADAIIIVYSPDTDSFVFSLYRTSWMNDLAELSDFLDFSNLKKDHPLYSVLNRNIPGLFKFECTVITT